MGLQEDVVEAHAGLHQILDQPELLAHALLDVAGDLAGLDPGAQVQRGDVLAELADHGLDARQVGGLVAAAQAAGVGQQRAVGGHVHIFAAAHGALDGEAALHQRGQLDLQGLHRVGQDQQGAAGEGLVALGAVVVEPAQVLDLLGVLVGPEACPNSLSPVERLARFCCFFVLSDGRGEIATRADR